jgi:hypothetical protein
VNAKPRDTSVTKSTPILRNQSGSKFVLMTRSETTTVLVGYSQLLA